MFIYLLIIGKCDNNWLKIIWGSIVINCFYIGFVNSIYDVFYLIFWNELIDR